MAKKKKEANGHKLVALCARGTTKVTTKWVKKKFFNLCHLKSSREDLAFVKCLS